MPCNAAIDGRIRAVVGEWRKTSSKKMLGGVRHLLRGNMICCVYKGFRTEESLRTWLDQARTFVRTLPAK
jgi:hypothetical protein